MAITICVIQNDDQTYTVELEPAKEMMGEAGAENGAADMAEDKAEGEMGQNFQTLEEALAAVPAMFEPGAQEPAAPMMDGEEEFSKGFKSVRGTPDEQYAARGR